MTGNEINKLERYLKKLFNQPALVIKQRPSKSDSVEVALGDEFIGLIYRDEEDGETSYHFEMSILDFDLE